MQTNAEKIKDKIRKLLALSDSPNEAEAQSALLKARDLMAQYKIEMGEITEAEADKIITCETGFTYTVRGEVWMSSLSSAIAENFCCEMAYSRFRRKQKRQILFIGYESDVESAIAAFAFVVGFVRRHNEAFKKKHKKSLSAARIRDFNLSYALGFTAGMKAAFKEQNAASETGLILVVPQEVKDYTRGVTKETKADVVNFSRSTSMFNSGFADGMEYGNGKLGQKSIQAS